jgi:flagellar hook assembly protein FlgD
VTFAFPPEPANDVVIYVVNLVGETVATVPVAGIHATEGWARWDGKDSSGKVVATGMYFYFVRSSHLKMRQKLTIIN